MKKILFLVIVLLNSFNNYSQNDSIGLIIGFNTESTFIYENITEYCTETGSKFISPSALVVCGIKKCERYGSENKYFEIMYRGKNYFIPWRNVNFKDESINYYQRIENLPDSAYLNYRQYANYVGLIYHSEKFNEIIKKMDGNKLKGLTILSWSPFDMSEYTDGTGARFEVYNPTKKTIKYISFTVRGYNPVDDPITAKNGQYSISLKGVGPIAPEESAKYSWDYIWFSGAFSYAKITYISITYMDGTIKNIENPRTVLLSEEDYNYITND